MPADYETNPHHDLVAHAIANSCDDADCELHNPDVALDEGVIGPTEVAYFYAGAMMMRGLMRDHIPNTIVTQRAAREATLHVRQVLRLPT